MGPAAWAAWIQTAASHSGIYAMLIVASPLVVPDQVPNSDSANAKCEGLVQSPLALIGCPGLQTEVWLTGKNR